MVLIGGEPEGCFSLLLRPGTSCLASSKSKTAQNEADTGCGCTMGSYLGSVTRATGHKQAMHKFACKHTSCFCEAGLHSARASFSRSANSTSGLGECIFAAQGSEQVYPPVAGAAMCHPRENTPAAERKLGYIRLCAACHRHREKGELKKWKKDPAGK